MNLRIDLMLPSERRSASLFNLKSMFRVGGLVIPAVVVLLCLSLFVDVVRLSSEVSVLEGQWKRAAPKKERSLTLQKRIVAQQAVRDEFKGWLNANVDWHRHLPVLQTQVPPDIQFTSLRLSQAIQLVEKKVPARAFTLVIEGKAVGEKADESVQVLRRRMADAFPGTIEDVAVTRYGAEQSTASLKEDRVFVFEIRCRYKPVPFI